MRVYVAFLMLIISSMVAYADEVKRRSLTMRWNSDTNVTLGSTDRYGDTKSGEFLYRDGVWVLGLASALKTPQIKKPNTQYDTATTELLLGYEGHAWGIYAAAGIVNGPALQIAHTLLLNGHKFIGIPSARISAASSHMKPAVEGIVRYDYIMQTLGTKKYSVGATITPFVRVGTVDVKAGVALFAVLPFSGSGVSRQDVPGLPAIAPSGNFLRLGFVGQWHGYAVNTNRVGTSKIDAAVVAGLAFERGNWNLAADAIFPLTPRVIGELDAPITEVSISITRKF